MKRYKWHTDRLAAMGVFFINCLLAAYISLRLLSDPYFVKTQTGFQLTGPGIYIMIVLLLVGTVYLNFKFLQKSYKARLMIGLVETVTLACVLRNIFIGHLYFGFNYHDYLKNIFVFILVSSAIYHTLFSRNIRDYFNEERTV